MNTGFNLHTEKKPSTFRRILVCLSDANQEVAPSKEERAILKSNGLGEMVVIFESEADSAHVDERILSAFEKEEMQMGYEILTLRTGFRTLLEVVHTGPCSSTELKLLNSQRLFLRPIQKSIPLLHTSPPANDGLLPCHVCGILYLTSELREHVEVCKKEDETSEKDEPLQPENSDSSMAPPSDDELPIGIEPELPQAPPSDDELPIWIEPELPQSLPSHNEEDHDLLQILSNVAEGLSEDTSVESIIESYRSEFVQGRALNLPTDFASADAVMQGETYKVMIARRSILQGVIDEFASEGYKPRLTLEVCFMGERGQDLGGLRKEFLRLALQAIKGRLMVENDASLTLFEDEDMVQQKAYFAAGIVIGQCIIQDGPKPDLLEPELVDRLVEDSCKSISEQQLMEGLRKTGILSVSALFIVLTMELEWIIIW
ncbi:uncharacterized protein LOC121406605 [Lytechinus variegatus]|uniref:uncharacterized protein LOC121406605 n=1 Tax=Lytechinus variegatus TaxID=7654 RepID=UPI001BB12A6B|nr:uncharacterized protein LOC121406605 [Lytechinus variegatus]